MKKKIARMKDPRANFVLADSSIGVETDSGAVSYVWDRVRQVWKFERVWLLMFASNPFITVPLAGVPADALRFIETKVPPRPL